MEEIKEYLTYQIEHLEKWDENKTLSEYGKGKLSGFKDILEQLLIHGVVLQSEQLPKTNCTLNRQTCGKGSGCKYPHCHI